MTKRNSCQGYCCAAFSIDFSPSEVRRFTKKRYGEDGLKIKAMLIPLGKHWENPVHPSSQDEHRTKRAHHYTCKWFDGETRSCLGYEARPAMCSSFPNMQTRCPYEGCNYRNEVELRKRRQRLKVLGDAEKLVW